MKRKHVVIPAAFLVYDQIYVLQFVLEILFNFVLKFIKNNSKYPRETRLRTEKRAFTCTH